MRILEWLHHPSTYAFALVSLVAGIGTMESLRSDPVDLTRFGPETSGLIVGPIVFAALLFIRIVGVGIVALLARLPAPVEPTSPRIGSAAKAVAEHDQWRA